MQDERQRLIDHILTIDRRFYQYLQAGGRPAWTDIDLTMPQLKVLLRVVGTERITMTQLALSLGMTLPTATGVVDRLVNQGLVRRESDPQDRRLVLLRPTEHGAALMERLLRDVRARLRQILDRLGLEDLRMVARALDIVFQAAMSIAEDETAASAGAGSPQKSPAN